MRLLIVCTLAVALFGCEPKRPPIPKDIGIPQELALAGQDVYYKHLCVDCHVIDGIGGKMGPSLVGIGSTRDTDYIRAYIKDPQAVQRTSSMPQTKLSNDELEAVTLWLAAHK